MNCYSVGDLQKGPLDNVPPRGRFKFIESVNSTSLSIVAILLCSFTKKDNERVPVVHILELFVQWKIRDRSSSFTC